MSQNKTPSPKKRLKERSEIGLTKDNVKAFTLELTTGSDRAAALIASSFLDTELVDLLQTIFKFRNSDDVNNLLRRINAPLSTF